MKTLVKLAIPLCLAGASYAENWNAKLLDASCADKGGGQTTQTSDRKSRETLAKNCAPTASTTAYAIEASGGCLIKAGENRYLVAKVSEKEKYAAAIRALGWLDGSSPPWVKANGSHPSDAKPSGPTNRSQPIRSETNRTSGAAGSRR